MGALTEPTGTAPLATGVASSRAYAQRVSGLPKAPLYGECLQRRKTAVGRWFRAACLGSVAVWVKVKPQISLICVSHVHRWQTSRHLPMLVVVPPPSCWVFMCGICGVVSDAPAKIEPAVRRMMSSMVHRGPDDEGYEFLTGGNAGSGVHAGFGFRRLAILDLTPTGHQPMFNPNTGDCIVFNGEIYNFQSLRAQLQCEGVRFRGTSDTEVLLHALSTWGEGALSRIHGMFAFAFFQAATQRLLLTRDPLGIKPLYISETRSEIVFASEVQALRKSGLIDDELDPDGIAEMLAFGAVQAPRTVHKAIRSFPAGHCAWLTTDATGGIRLSDSRPYWCPRWGQSDDSPETAAQKLRSLLQEAVSRHSVADLPVGLLLSAGIDSTVLAALSQSSGAPLKTFTVGFESYRLRDESEEAAATASLLGMEHTRILFSPEECQTAWTGWLGQCDLPSIDGFNTFLACKGLADHGIPVGISGLGADELFGGYDSFRQAPLLSRVLWALRAVNPETRRRLAGAICPSRNRQWEVAKFRDLLGADLSVGGITLSLRRVLSDETVRGICLSLLKWPTENCFPIASRSGTTAEDAFNQVSRIELKRYMGNTLLRDSDYNSMRHSLELRVPFLDFNVVDYVCTLKGSAKATGRVSNKPLLRAASSDLIPHHLVNRPKTGFGLPMWEWMLGPWRESCEAAISTLEQCPLIDGATVRRTWNAYLDNAARMHWSRPMCLVSLGSYLQ